MNTTILQEAGKEENWTAFLFYKKEKQHLSKAEEKEILDFMERKAYLPLCDAWQQGQFPSCLPHKKTVNKEGSQKKRIVYSFPGDEGIFLKFIAFWLYRYNHCFCDNCYAFRRDLGVREALGVLRSDERVPHMYCLKADIHNYFNSIYVPILLDKLAFLKEEDVPLYQLFHRILSENRVWENKRIVHENHGAMAGTPISPFLANLYLTDVDTFFQKEGILYFRYSDDILIFESSMEALWQRRKQLYALLAKKHLSVNPDKVKVYAPGEAIEFLGFRYQAGEIDLSENTLRKTKAKIRRKADSLRRWQSKKNLPAEKAAIGFIRAMNRKFYGTSLPQEDESTDEFSWNRWFFPNLTTAKSLHFLDIYLQEYIRYTVTGRHYKGNYKISYDILKSWGYRSLVHEYYRTDPQNQ